ncbi:MAG: hypothetical protein QM496_05190 [Verrucomicrobiota bacterium]
MNFFHKTMKALINAVCVLLVAMSLLVLPLCAEEVEHESAHAHQSEHEHDHEKHAHVEGVLESIQDSDFYVDDSLSERTGLGRYLFGHIHAYTVFGDSTANPADLALGDHDPNNQVGVQAIEPSLTLQAGWLQGYINVSGVTDGSGDFFYGIEEGFLKLVDLPYGFELRGGQFLNSMGFQNARHNHDWKFVDQTLVNGRFLNEGELFTQGGEIRWKLPVLEDSQMIVSVGGMPAHSHGEDAHDEGGEFESEGADFTDTLSGANWVSRFKMDEERTVIATVSGVWGRNKFGRTNQVYGVGFEYLWKQDVHGGKYLRWRNEAMYRNIKAVSGHLPGEAPQAGGQKKSLADFGEFGIYSMLLYGFNEHIETGVRGGWVAGIDQMVLEQRFRMSPVITWYLNEKKTLQTRLQYNLDYLSGSGAEHSIWLQIGFNWGARGAHHGHAH